jgi:hypothetical protein
MLQSDLPQEEKQEVKEVATEQSQQPIAAAA